MMIMMTTANANPARLMMMMSTVMATMMTMMTNDGDDE
jgi:hypothetical protein